MAVPYSERKDMRNNVVMTRTTRRSPWILLVICIPRALQTVPDISDCGSIGIRPYCSRHEIVLLLARGYFFKNPVRLLLPPTATRLRNFRQAHLKYFVYFPLCLNRSMNSRLTCFKYPKIIITLPFFRDFSDFKVAYFCK